MAMKIVVALLAALTVVTADEMVKRQTSMPEISEFFNNLQTGFKPPDFGGFPTSMQNLFGSFPSIPGMGGSGSSGSGNNQYKRQVDPNTISEWFNKFQESGNNFSGNLPFKPPTFGQLPTFGGSSGSSGSGNQNS